MAPALLYTHGFGSSAAFWAPTIAALPGDHTAIVWDLRGHGTADASDDPADYTVAHCLADMAGLLDEAGAERAVLVGHSLGGFLSLTFTLDHPDRVAGLVLVATGPGYRSDRGRDGWNAMAEGLARDAPTPGLALAARGILRQVDGRVIDGLPSIEVPAVVVVGERDRQFLAGAEYMAAKLPDAVLVTVPGAGHELPATHPAALADATLGLLARV